MRRPRKQHNIRSIVSVLESVDVRVHMSVHMSVHVPAHAQVHVLVHVHAHVAEHDVRPAARRSDPPPVSNTGMHRPFAKSASVKAIALSITNVRTQMSEHLPLKPALVTLFCA